MRGSEKTFSIISAVPHTASEQCSGVRPTLDAHVAACCSAIRVRGRLLRPLPIKAVDHDEALRFGEAVRR